MATASLGQENSSKETRNENKLPRLWSSIASLNTSRRNMTNTLEVRLENDEGVSFSLNNEEIERLLRRLNIKAKDFTSVQACPERRNVVFITLGNGVDINKFTQNCFESFILKDGIRTTTIKQASKREVQVQIMGLHPDTRDDAVIRYLNAHGQVNMKLPVVYGVYQGVSGSSLLAGKRNSTREYTMEVMKNIGSTHIIDGERVSVRCPGQMKTCNKCHKTANICPGRGLAKACTSEKILLSEHIISYWQNINFVPEQRDMNEVDNEGGEEAVESTINQVNQTQVEPKPNMNSNMIERYGGVVIKGIKTDTDIDEFITILKEAGLPSDYSKEDMHIIDKRQQRTINIHDLQPDVCVKLSKKLHGTSKMGKTISVHPLVEDTPLKTLSSKLESLLRNSSEDECSKEDEKSDETNNKEQNGVKQKTSSSKETGKGRKLWADQLDTSDSEEDVPAKRKAGESPEVEFEKSLTKREKKKLRKLLNKSK